MRWMGKYLRKCADKIGLEGHDVAYKPGATSVKCIAEMERTENQCISVLFEPGFAKRPAAEQRRVVAHELAHGYFSRFDDLIEYACSKLDDDAAELLLRQFQDAEEEAAERMARVFAPLLPLPPKRGTR